MTKERKLTICCICHQPIQPKGSWYDGNDPWPVSLTGRCCDDCDMRVVLPARLRGDKP